MTRVCDLLFNKGFCLRKIKRCQDAANITAKGADASALCFSVIETAKRNKLDPFGYLLFLLQELSKLGNEPTREQLLPLLPWSTALPEYCHLS